MTLQSVFIINADDYENLAEVNLPENTYLAYRIADFSFEKIILLYKRIFLGQRNFQFCLLLDVSHGFTYSQTILDLLVSFSFHSNYIKKSFDNPQLLFEVSKLSINEYLPLLRDAFKSQGYIDIDLDEVYKSRNPHGEVLNKNIRFDLTYDLSNLAVAFTDSIKTLRSFDSLFCFFLEDAKMFPETIEAIEKIEQKAKQEFPELFSLLNENKDLKTKEKNLVKKIESLEDRGGLPGRYDSAYISAVDRYKKQISELLKFYNYEYEILPAWYKRLGHIIKVLTGKRSFKSLFNDDVKKYKD